MKYFWILFAFFLSLQSVFAAKIPPIECGNLPGCSGDGASKDETFGIIGKTIETGIQYVAVIAVIAVMIGWVMYLISSWEEEKTKKAKNVIIWALVGVFISVAAYSLVSIINNFRI